MTDEIIDIINEDNEVIGQAPINEIIDKKLLHRRVRIVIANNNEFLIGKKHDYKKKSSGKYEIGIDNAVKANETYEDAMFRELKEVLNIDSPPTFVKKLIYKDKILKTIAHVFVLTYEKEIIFNKNKITNTKFISTAKIEEMMDQDELSDFSGYIFINAFEEIKVLAK